MDLLAPYRSLAPDRSVAEALAEAVAAGADERAAAAARLLVEGFDAADPARASVVAIANEWCGGESMRSGASRPAGGYGRLVAYLEERCARAGAVVLHDCPVREIRYADGAARIAFAPRVTAANVDARYAIVTASLGVLQADDGAAGAISFEPALPASHRAALNALAFGSVVKVVLRFRRPFWESLEGGRFRRLGFIRLTGSTFPTFWTLAPRSVPVLTAWVGGPRALALRSRSLEERASLALDDVVRIFGDAARAEFVEAYQHDWDGDPYVRGAYSYALVGAGNARRDLAAPIASRLAIAGEATARVAEVGTVAGALESGIAAARAAVATLRSG